MRRNGPKTTAGGSVALASRQCPCGGPPSRSVGTSGEVRSVSVTRASLPGSGRRLGPLAILTCLGVIAISGCARKPPLAQVEGTVRLDGQALPDLLVCFLPDPDRGAAGPRSVAVTDENGRYQLRCDDRRDGAVLGWHRVLLEDMTLYSAPRQDRAGGSRPALVSRLPPRYTTATQTPLSFEVKPGTQTIDLDLKSRP